MIKKINRKQLRNYFLIILVAGGVWLARLVYAQGVPNPGHSYTQVGGGITQGDLLYGSANDTLAILPKSTTASRYLANTGTDNNPVWAAVDLNNGVTGTLPMTNGGTGSNPSGANQILMSTSQTATTWKNINDCQGINKALSYNQTSGEFGCNTIETGGYTLHVQALSYNPSSNQTVYFSSMPAAPNTSIARGGRIYITRSGTITAAVISSYASTAGSNQNWAMYIRVNNNTDYLIQTLGVAANERVWTNSNMSIPVVLGDYLTIKAVQPGWSSRPRGVVFNGYIYVE